MSRYQADVSFSIAMISEVLPFSGLETPFELRFPFLDRRLVEFSLKLAPRLRTQPGARKTILRHAMRSILPDIITSRTGKGSVSGRLHWSILNRKDVIRALMTNSILAELGFILPDRLLKEAHDFRTARAAATLDIFLPLSLETWLQVRSGRWLARNVAGHSPIRCERIRSRVGTQAHSQSKP